jgi:hypothetical protein
MAKHILPIIKKQLPEFIKSEHPNFQLFVEAYYEYLEQQNDSDSTSALNLFKTVPNAGDLIQNAEAYRDVDTTLTEFKEYFRRQLTPFTITGNAVSDEIIFKKARDVYLAKGTPNAFKLLFRMLFGKEADVFEPKTQIIQASESLFTSFTQIKAEVVLNETNLGDFNYELSTIRLDSDAVDSDSSANILTVLDGTFTGVTKNNNTVLTLYLTKNPDSDMGGRLVKGREVILRDSTDTSKVVKVKLLNHIGNTSIIDGGAGFRVGDKFFVNDTANSIPIQVSKIQSGEIDRVMIRNRGKGYRVGDTIEFVSPGGVDGAGALGFVTAVDAEGAVTEIDGSQVRLGGTGYLSEDFEPVIVPIIQKGQYTHIPEPFIRTTDGTGLDARGLSSEVGKILEVSTPQTGFFDSDQFGVPQTVSPFSVRIANQESIDIGNVVEFQHFSPDSDAGSMRHDSEVITINLKIEDSDGICNDSDTLYWSGTEELGTNYLYEGKDNSDFNLRFAPGSDLDSDGILSNTSIILGVSYPGNFDKHKAQFHKNGIRSMQYAQGKFRSTFAFGLNNQTRIDDHYVNYSSNRKYFFKSGNKFKLIKMPVAWDSENYNWKIRSVKYYDSDGDSDFIERWKSDSEFDIQGVTPTYYSWNEGETGPRKWARWVSAWAGAEEPITNIDSDGRGNLRKTASITGAEPGYLGATATARWDKITSTTRVAGKPGQKYGYPSNVRGNDSEIYDSDNSYHFGQITDGSSHGTWSPTHSFGRDSDRTTVALDSDSFNSSTLGHNNGNQIFNVLGGSGVSGYASVPIIQNPLPRHAVQAFPVKINDPRLYRLDKFHINQLQNSAANDSELTQTYTSQVFVSADEADSDGSGKGTSKNIGTFVSTGYGGVVTTKSTDGTSFTLSKADSEQVVSTLNVSMKFPNDSDIDTFDKIPHALLRVIKVNPQDGSKLSQETFPVSNTVVQFGSPKINVQFPLTTETEKTFLNESGFLSSVSGGVLRDNFTVSEYSYIIQSDLNMNSWRGPIKDTLHPAGLYLFGELNVNTLADTKTSEVVKPTTDIGSEVANLTFDADDDFFNDKSTAGVAVFADSIAFGANPFNIVSPTNDASGTFLTADYTQRNVESSILSQRGNSFFDYEPVGLVHKVWTIFDSEGHYNYVRSAIDSDSDLKVKFGMYFTPRKGDGKLILGNGFDSDFFKRSMTTQKHDSEITRLSRVNNTKTHYVPSEFHSAKRYNNVETIGISQIKYEDFEQFRVYDSEIPKDIFQRFDALTVSTFEKIDYNRIKDSDTDVDTFAQAIDRTREIRIGKSQDFNTAMRLNKELVFVENGTTYYDIDAYERKYNIFNSLRDSEYNEGWRIPGKDVALGNITYIAPDSEMDSDQIIRDSQIRNRFAIENVRGFSDVKSPRSSRAFGNYLGGGNTIIVSSTYPSGAGINNTTQLLGTITDSDYKENLEFKRKN